MALPFGSQRLETPGWDSSDGSYQTVLIARVAAVLDAQRALAEREAGAAPALRQSLVDLASIATLLAADLA